MAADPINILIWLLLGHLYSAQRFGEDDACSTLLWQFWSSYSFRPNVHHIVFLARPTRHGQHLITMYTRTLNYLTNPTHFFKVVFSIGIQNQIPSNLFAFLHARMHSMVWSSHEVWHDIMMMMMISTWHRKSRPMAQSPMWCPAPWRPGEHWNLWP